MNNMTAIVGGGAWGTALAAVSRRAGRRTALYCRDAQTAHSIRDNGTNPRYLPGISLGPGIEASDDPSVLAQAGIVILALPAQHLRGALPALVAHLPPDAVLVNTAKGIEVETGLTLSRVIAQVCPDHAQAVLSGPSFASDVAAGKPTAVTLAAADEARALHLCRAFGSDTFRAYASSDIVGVETGGALKNVYAIAAGIVMGMGYGESAKAALITRAFVELRRLGAAMGGAPQTFMGLSGFGDLMLSCASAQSRNFGYGMALGQGADLEGRPLAEGAATVRIAGRIAEDRGIDAPILHMTRRLLGGEVTPDDAMQALLSRPLKEEF